MAVTREGIPIRVWCWPGDTSESPLIRQVKGELRTGHSETIGSPTAG